MAATTEQSQLPVPPAPPPEPRASRPTRLQGVTKAAALLLSLDEDTRSKILRLLSVEEVEMISREVARLPPIPAAEVKLVLQEFEDLNHARRYVLEGGVDYARTMLIKAFGPDGLPMVERVLNSLGTDTTNLVALQKIDPRQLSKLIYNEHPQVIAVVLSHLAPEQAAALLNALPTELRPEVARRMAQLDQFSSQVIDQIASFIGRRLKAVGEFSRKSYGGVRAVAEMMNRLDRDASDQILSTIGRDNETLSDTVRQLMFVFEDILNLNTEDIRVLLSNIDRKALAIAIKGSSEKLRNHFVQCMSKNAAEMFVDDIESQGPVRIKDLEAARSQIIAVVRQLQTEGTIGGQGAGDQYVV
jgi:flagellar motor switch protein FliG